MQKISAMLQGNNKNRNDLLWTGLGGNYFPWTKIF